MEPHTIALEVPPSAAKDRQAIPLHFGDLTVTAIEVDHDPTEPAYAYRFDCRRISVVVSGDTRFRLPLARASQGADVLVHEAQSQLVVQLIQKAAANVGDLRIAQTMADIQRYHTDPLTRHGSPNKAGTRLLVLTHLNPPPSNPLLRRMFSQGIYGVRKGKWIIGEDGTLITLPIGSIAITMKRLKPQSSQTHFASSLSSSSG